MKYIQMQMLAGTTFKSKILAKFLNHYTFQELVQD